MKITLRVLLLVSLVIFCSSCGLFGRSKAKEQAKPAAPAAPAQPQLPAEMPYLKDGIVINIKSDPQLNLFQGLSHSLVLCIYQLKDPNQFVQLAEREDGINTLKRCDSFEGVANVRRDFVQPGTDRSVVTDRAEGVRYLAIVAGYSTKQKERITKLYQIPPDVALQTGPLNVELSLGAHAIQDFKVR